MKLRSIATAGVILWLAGCGTTPSNQPAGNQPAGNQQSPAPEAEPIASLTLTEGPTVDRDGAVYFTVGGVVGARLLKWTDAEPAGTEPGLRGLRGRVEVVRQYGAGALIFDAEGRLLAAERGPEGDRPGVTRTNVKSGEVEWLADRYQGKRFDNPNDLTIDGKGRVYFTDRPGAMPSPDETGINAVYRVDPDRTVTQILKAPDIERPNGIVISPDDRTLYLIEAHIKTGGARLIRAYDLSPAGTVANMRVFYNFSPGRSGDGMTVDTQGNLYVAAGLNIPRGSDETMDNKAGVYVISPMGRLLRFIPIPEDLVTNVAFGGPDMKTLYVTAGKTLFRVRVETAGTGR